MAWTWGSWLLGAAVLAAVVFLALHFSEGREFLSLAQRARPRWLAVAFLLQAATYFAQAEVFRGAPRRAGFPLRRRWLAELSVTKLFLDQALPSAGISSTVVVTRALQQAGVSRGVAAAGALINIASYNAAYVVALFVALGLTIVDHAASRFVVVVSILFLVFSIAMTAAVLALAGRRSRRLAALGRLPVVKGLLGFMEDADAPLMRNAPLMLGATLWQIAIIALDAATMWVLLRAIGAPAPVTGVFASFMISSLFRTVGIVPGGLGTYEATSVLMLRLAGIGLPAALSATLLFRGLSFWLPMLPGLWFSRRVLGRTEGPRPFANLGAYWALDRRDRRNALGLGPRRPVAAGRRRAPATPSARTSCARSPPSSRLARARRRRCAARCCCSSSSPPSCRRSRASGWTPRSCSAIVVATVGVGYPREYGAQAAVAALRARARTQTTRRCATARGQVPRRRDRARRRRSCSPPAASCRPTRSSSRRPTSSSARRC